MVWRGNMMKDTCWQSLRFSSTDQQGCHLLPFARQNFFQNFYSTKKKRLNSNCVEHNIGKTIIQTIAILSGCCDTRACSCIGTLVTTLLGWVKIPRLMPDHNQAHGYVESSWVNKSQPCVPNMVHDVRNWKHRNANADDDPVSKESLWSYCNGLQVYLTSLQALRLC